MEKHYETLPTIKLNAGSDYFHINELEIIHIDDPALSAMTDFQQEKAFTIKPKSNIHEALIEMKVAGVHMLLVINTDEQVIGIITSEDILGEKAIRITEERRIAHQKMTVDMVMIPQNDIATFDHFELRHAKVGNIIETLHELKQHYALVVDVEPQTKQQTIRGVFSIHTISKQLGKDVSSDISGAQTLAELQHNLNE